MIFIDTCILIDYSKDIIAIDEKDKKAYCFNSIVQLEFVLVCLDLQE